MRSADAGDVSPVVGEAAAAAGVAHRRALDVLRGAGRCDLVTEVLIDLGYTLSGSGALDAAEEALRSGRAMLEEQGRRDERGWAHATAGLGMRTTLPSIAISPASCV